MMPVSATRKSLDKLAVLEKAEISRRLPRDVIQQLSELAVIRDLEPGQVLFTQGERASALYIVAEGELRSVRQDAKGREQVLATERAGALLAAVPVFDSGRFYSTTIADGFSRVLSLENRSAQELFREHPQLLWNVVRILGQTIREYAETIETLALKNVDQRVAQFLLSLCEQASSQDGNCRLLKLTMTQPEMAARVGSTREVVCRALAHLQKYGYIEMISPHEVTIPDIRLLRRFAGIERALREA